MAKSFQGSRSTLILIVLIFYIGSSIWNLWQLYGGALSGISYNIQHGLLALLDIAYITGGSYLLLKLDELLPRYRNEIVRWVTIGFAIQVALSFWAMMQFYFAPQTFAPELSGDVPPAILLVPFVGLAIAYLIYRVTVNSIDAVSRGEVESKSQPHKMLYWAIVVVFFLAMFVAILWDPATNSFNLL